MEFNDIVKDFAVSLKNVDDKAPTEPTKQFKPGVGPLQENTLTRMVVEDMASRNPYYLGAGPYSYPSGRKKCDLVINHEWAVEVKLARPFGDNNREAEHWSINLLHPYPGNTSLIGDCIKLTNSGFPHKKGILVIGYEHSPAIIPLDPAINGFELLTREIAGIILEKRTEIRKEKLIHPVHQVARIFGWQILG